MRSPAMTFDHGQVAIKFGFPADYERSQLLHFEALLQKAARFVDVGANKGLYSYVANEHLRDRDIFLIEADPRLAAALQNDVASWPSHKGNRLKVMHMAASDQAAMLNFKLGTLDTVGTISSASDRKVSDSVVRVPADSLDALIAPVPDTLFKIDVEGFEYRVLSGAMRNLQAPGAIVLVELHSWGDPERRAYPLQVLRLMLSYGFAVRRIESSYTYEFYKASPKNALLSYLRYWPAMFAKYFIRVTGMRSTLQRIGLARRNT